MHDKIRWIKRAKALVCAWVTFIGWINAPRHIANIHVTSFIGWWTITSIAACCFIESICWLTVMSGPIAWLTERVRYANGHGAPTTQSEQQVAPPVPNVDEDVALKVWTQLRQLGGM